MKFEFTILRYQHDIDTTNPFNLCKTKYPTGFMLTSDGSGSKFFDLGQNNFLMLRLGWPPQGLEIFPQKIPIFPFGLKNTQVKVVSAPLFTAVKSMLGSG